jgi:hypothetical protein
MIQSLLIANRGEIACRIIRTQILPGTGRGTMRSMVEGHGRSRVSFEGQDILRVPLHHRLWRWSPSPFRRGFA